MANKQETKNGVKNIKNFTQKYINYIITALAFVVALAWRDAFKNFFQNNKYLNSYGPWIYAVVLTIIIVIIIIILENTNESIKNIPEKSDKRDSVNDDN